MMAVRAWRRMEARLAGFGEFGELVHGVAVGEGEGHGRSGVLFELGLIERRAVYVLMFGLQVGGVVWLAGKDCDLGRAQRTPPSVPSGHPLPALGKRPRRAGGEGSAADVG